jgi:hypothetical protein
MREEEIREAIKPMIDELVDMARTESWTREILAQFFEQGYEGTFDARDELSLKLREEDLMEQAEYYREMQELARAELHDRHHELIRRARAAGKETEVSNYLKTKEHPGRGW